MLRESVTLTGAEVNIDGLTDPSVSRIQGVPYSEELIRFSDAFIAADPDALAAAREALAAAISPEAMVDAAGIASNFQRMDRIADAIGIPSDAPMVVMSEGVRAQLGLDRYVSAGNTPKLPWYRRLLIKLLALRAFRRMIREISAGAR